MTSAPPEKTTRATPYDTVIVLSGLVAIGIGAVYWLMRLGFTNPVSPVIKPVALGLFIFSFPATVNLISFQKRQWWSFPPFLWLSALVISAALGRIQPIIGLNAFPLLALIGAASFAIVFVRWIPRASIWRTLALIVGSLAFSVWASGVVWGRIYKNPLFFENFVLDGKAHHDSLVLAAIGNMLRTYHAASTGIDGLNYVPYHWGTPWLFAQWSNLIGSEVLDFYQLGFPVMMIPLFFAGTLGFSVALRSFRERSMDFDLRDDFRLWLVFLAAAIGLIPISGLDAMAVWTSNILISESYTVAIPCALLFLATVIAFYKNLRRGSLGEIVFALGFLPLGVVALGYLKISLMILAFAAGIYTLVRLRLYRNNLFVASAVLTTILVFFAYTRVSLPAHREGLAPLDFLWNFVRPAWWPFFIVVHLFWSWLYAFFRLRSEGIGTLADVKEAAAEGRILDVEIVILIALLGLGPGLVTHIDGGSAFYFSDVQRWLALGFILARIPDFFSSLIGEAVPRPSTRRTARRSFLDKIDAISARSVALGFLLIPIIGSIGSNALVWPLTMARANAETRYALYPAPQRAKIPTGLHGLPYLHDENILATGLQISRNFVVGHALRNIAATPAALRRHTALFIPQDQSPYWQSLTRPGACTFAAFVAPAMGDIAMIDGMPAYGCTLSHYYGLGSFAPRSRQQVAADLEPPNICRRANDAGFDRVLVLTFPNARADLRPIECRAR
ncbi:MAG TPA: hypothetical protein VM099_11655 [Gemmatimonadaceae bacterium]|nr:hypothetical protein [Gemmatimonadaceae bacterium]